MYRHEGQPGGCSCGTPGWQALLSCGCWSWYHGQPRVGGYITCGMKLAHQASYKIIEIREGGNAAGSA